MSEKDNLIRHKKAVDNVYSKINDAIRESEFSELLEERGTQDNRCTFSMAGYNFSISARHTDTNTIFRTFISNPVSQNTSYLDEITEMEMITTDGSSVKFNQFRDKSVVHNHFAEIYFGLILEHGIPRFKDPGSQ